MPIVDESKQNKGVNNNTRNKQMAIDMEYYNRLNHPRFKSPYLGAKYQQRVIPVRTLNGVQDVFVDNRGTIKQGGHTHSKLYNYSNKNRNHPIKGAYAREVDSWNNNTSPIKALVNSGIGYALAPAAQAVYDYTKGALDISKNPTKASNYLVMLPAIGYAVKAPLKRGVEVAMRTSNNANPIEDIVYNMHKASPKKHAGVLSYISTGVGYNTYAPEAYTGFQKAAKGNDMIDAYLYNKTINPSYGVKKINVDYGPHENYIRKIYPYKDIPIYENTMAVQVITDNDSIYDYWYEDGQLYGRRKSNKVPFKINSDKANSIIFPQVQAKGVDPTKPTSTLVYHPAKYKEMPTAKKISTPKQKEETMWERGKQLINLVGNGLSRKLQLFFDSEPEHTSKRIKISNKKVTKNKRRENLEIEISPNSYTINDTTKINSRRYRIPESINLTKHTFGYRNRGDYTPINSVAAPITAFSNFKSKESISPNNQNYIGIDSIGKFVFGKYSDIPNGSMISPTFKNTVTGFKTDSKDNVLFMESNSNGSRKSPILNAIVNGKSVNNRLNFLANNNRTDEYGSIAGGRIIIQAGKEVRLVSGSIDNIRDEIEAMKSRNNVKTVDLYTLDNGTYHSGLRTFDKIFTRDDLLEYDAQNTGGGNFLYIK